MPITQKAECLFTGDWQLFADIRFMKLKAEDVMA